MRLCKDCASYWRPYPPYNCSARCEARATSFTDPVDGETRYDGIVQCFASRQEGGDCGPKGKLWAPRPRPWWRFW